MKLGRDEVLIVPYKCCCFLARSAQGRIQGGAKIGHGVMGCPLLQESSSSDRKATATNRMHSNDIYCVFGPIGKLKWPLWPLICWHIFDFSSATAEQNSTILDRKQDLNVFYQVCVFGLYSVPKLESLNNYKKSNELMN